MGNLFSIPCDPCVNRVFDWLDEKRGYTRNLRTNLVALETKMEELNARQDDLSRRVTREETNGLQRLAEIQVWLTRVDVVKEQVNGLLRVRDVELQRLCLCGFCSTSLTSSYHYGKNVFLTLQEVERLKCRGDFEVVAEKPQTSSESEVQERPLERIIVGQERMLDKAWKQLIDDGVGVMGLYGMGGVGKTTLLKQLNNKFTSVRLGFDYVIWIVVSKELQVEKIQEEIAMKIGVGEVDKCQRVDAIYNQLRNKRFVLFLDDIWEKVDLSDIGVPNPTRKNKCKVVFTTRSHAVCASMGVDDKMEVQCLDDKEAFDLFKKKVGQRTLGSDPRIAYLARIVAKKCSGLPLALNVIGETMSSKRTIQEWRHSIDVLNSYATQFKGMKDKILPLLKFSYDNLKGEHLQSCLLYCALFPEDCKIRKENLIDYWICEGIIDGHEGMEKAENKGYEIIGSLVRASLLIDHVDYVSMHDVVREMALWIASDLGENREAFIVFAGVGLKEIPKVKNWKVVRRMSLMNNKIIHLPGTPECLELTTLLMQQNYKFEKIPREFFESMPKLSVLDLSDNEALSGSLDGILELGSLQYLNLSKTRIDQLSMGLKKQTALNLEGTFQLSSSDGISKLGGSLLYLNLSYTPIDHLPMGLKKLIHLDLENAYKLKSIAGISKMHSLKVLKLLGSSISWDHHAMTELETLQHLEILTIDMEHPQLLRQFLRSRRLTGCIRSLKIKNMNMESSSGLSLPVTMDKLREFIILNSRICEIKMTNFLSLFEVTIAGCNCLKELTLLMFAPNLKALSVERSFHIEDIINKEKARKGEELGIVPFRKLKSLKLAVLLELTNIYWRSLPFPCLETISVNYCPRLKKLPINSQSGKRGKDELIISYGDKSWIQSVEWEDEATKTRFLSSCKELEY